MSVGHLGSLAELNAAIKAHKYVVVDFYATWCGPCKMLAPKLESMAKQYPNVKFFKVDVDVAGDASEEYGVEAMPTIIVFQDGAKTQQVVGANEEKIRQHVQALQ